MKIVVIGGTGLTGSKTVAILRQGGQEVIAASLQSGVNTITGEGLKEVMAGARVVIDLANSPSFEDKAVLEFFEPSGRSLLAAEAAAGIRHHVALSIIGTDRSDNGYFRAKVGQEKLIMASGIPYIIIRSTQFMEFLRGIADSATDGNVVRLPPGLFQPIAADDVALVVAEVALAAPRNGIVEIAGPERAMPRRSAKCRAPGRYLTWTAIRWSRARPSIRTQRQPFGASNHRPDRPLASAASARAARGILVGGQGRRPTLWTPPAAYRYDDFCFLGWFELAGFEGREIEDQMQLFAEEVMPVIARERGGRVTCRSAVSSMLPDKSWRSPRNGRPATSSYGKVGIRDPADADGRNAGTTSALRH